MSENFQDSDKYETVSVESKVRKGFFCKVIKDLATGKAISCSCGCWTKGGKPCPAMKSIGI